MKTTTPMMICTSRCLKLASLGVICLVAVTLSAVYGCRWAGSAAVPPGAEHSRRDITQEALKIAATLRGPAHLLMPPMLHMQRSSYPKKHPGTRGLWIVLCEAQHQQLNMLFDDSTGRLVCLIMDRPQSAGLRVPPRLRTQADAARMGVQRLKTLDVLPPGAEILLAGLPRREGHNQFWGMTWRVRGPAARRPYEIKMVLDCGQGLPTGLFDTRQSG